MSQDSRNRNGVIHHRAPTRGELLVANALMAVQNGTAGAASPANYSRRAMMPVREGENPTAAAIPYTLGIASPASLLGYYAGNAVNRQVGNYQRARAMGNEVSGQHKGLNNLQDAMRHAEWNRRMANEIGPFTAWSMGVGNEIAGMGRSIMKGEPIDWAAVKMDLHNNAAGREAAAQGRPVDINKLRQSPGDNRPIAQKRYRNDSY